MVGQKRRPSAIDPANENFELRPTPVSPFLYGGVANFSWAQHNLHNLHANCTFKQKYLPFIMYYGSAICVVYRPTTLFSNILTDHCKLGYQTLLVCKFQTCIYLLRFLRYWDSNWRTKTTRRIGEIVFLPYLSC